MFSKPWVTGVREMDSLRLGVLFSMGQIFQLKDKDREGPKLKGERACRAQEGCLGKGEHGVGEGRVVGADAWKHQGLAWGLHMPSQSLLLTVPGTSAWGPPTHLEVPLPAFPSEPVLVSSRCSRPKQQILPILHGRKGRK